MFPVFLLLSFCGCQSLDPLPPPPPQPPPRPVVEIQPVKADPIEELGRIVPPPAPQVENDPSASEAQIQFRAAVALYQAKKYRYAAAAFEEVVHLDRHRLDARFFNAVSLLCIHQPKAALPSLKEVIAKRNSGYVEPARLLLAYAYIQKKDFRAARQALKQLDTPESSRLMNELDRLGV